MAISREEIEQIAQAVAKKISVKAQACRCGMALWEARSNSESFDAVVQNEQPGWLGRLPELTRHSLTTVEEICGVDMSKPKELAQRLASEIQEEDWQKARTNVPLLRVSIISPVIECSLKEET